MAADAAEMAAEATDAEETTDAKMAAKAEETARKSSFWRSTVGNVKKKT